MIAHAHNMNGRMAEWKNGRMAGWQDSRMAGWQNGMALLGHRTKGIVTINSIHTTYLYTTESVRHHI